MLRAFNAEFDEPAPPQDELAVRVAELIDEGSVVLLADSPPAAIAVLRFRRALWTARNECYLAELYVQPELRGRGIGRKMMEAVLDAARARECDYIDLGTSEDDTAARALYESMGFTNREGSSDGPVMLYYERDL
jgi:ribosomal protein S18 acetylase RimI-like enzyme